MPDEVIQGKLVIDSPGSADPFNVLTISTQSFATPDNLVRSYFIVARDVFAAPPNGAVVFSVRGDGSVTSGPIASPTITGLQAALVAQLGQIINLQGEVLGLRQSVQTLADLIALKG